LNDNLIFIGGKKGQLGVMDFRNTKELLWKPLT
jgi:hypothetical protein